MRVESELSDGRKSCLYLYTDKSLDAGGLENELQSTYYLEFLRNPLTQRAWVYQEQVFSPRTLYFAASQIMWRCSHCVKTEDNIAQHYADAHDYPILRHHEPIAADSLASMWYEGAVPSYMSRNLTHQSDRLVAISALAKATYLKRHVPYVAGLWKDSILFGMMWKRDGPGSKSRTYRCPSWSWASQNSQIDYNSATRTGPHALVYDDDDESGDGEELEASVDSSRLTDPTFYPKVLAAQVTPDTVNRFGSVKDGYLVLDTALTTGWVLHDSLEEFNAMFPRRLLLTGDKRTGVIWDANAMMDEEDPQSTQVAVAYMGKNHKCNILLLLVPPVLGASEYRRVGLAELNHDAVGGLPKPFVPQKSGPDLQDEQETSYGGYDWADMKMKERTFDPLNDWIRNAIKIV